MYLADLQAAMAALGPRLAQIYGQGESPMTITVLSKFHHSDYDHPRYLERLASVGLANRVVEVTVRDAGGAELPPGKTGEICVRGEVVMSGYWANPEASAAALRRGRAPRGQGANNIWLWARALGALDARGFPTAQAPSQGPLRHGRPST